MDIATADCFEGVCGVSRRCIIMVAFASMCFILLQMWMVLLPLHWSPPQTSLSFVPDFLKSHHQERERADRIEAALLGLKALSSESFREHHQRLLRLEQGVTGAKGFLDIGILQRVAALEEFANAYLASTATDCPSGLSNYSSSVTMRNAGWLWSFDQIIFSKHYFQGWMEDTRVGYMSLQVNTSGSLRLDLANSHQSASDKNEVYVSVNDELVWTLGKGERTHICVRLDVGDIVRISEVYGQIQLFAAEMSCAQNAASADRSRSFSSSARSPCVVGQKVFVRERVCESSKLISGEIQRILNETRAIVKLSDQANLPQRSGEAAADTSLSWIVPSRFRLVTPVEVEVGGTAGATNNCNGFSFKRHLIGIIMVADMAYRAKYAMQIRTQQCYAAWRGYAYAMLDVESYPACRRFGQFFFQKHCVVSEFLGEQRPGYVAAVIDADIVAVVLDRGLEEWTNVDADIHFYERTWCFEIAAGNYIVKATAWARNFLMRWAEFVYLQPEGFASADNGAIHLHIIQTLELEGSDECRRLYTSIGAPNKTSNEAGLHATELDTYFTFVNCTKHVLGPPRLWRTSGGGALAFWGKLHFFVGDGVYLGWQSSNYFGPVFHHGVKESEKVSSYFYLNVDRCKINAGVIHKGRESFSKFVETQAKFLTGHLARWPYKVTFPGPPRCNSTNLFDPCLLPCVSTLSCPLLGNIDQPRPRRSCTECQQS